VEQSNIPMNKYEKIIVSEQDKINAMKQLEQLTPVSIQDTLIEYIEDLNKYCFKYSIKSYDELMFKADELAFSPEDCFDILYKYSFVTRHSSEF
jgi:hypothetical protein